MYKKFCAIVSVASASTIGLPFRCRSKPAISAGVLASSRMALRLLASILSSSTSVSNKESALTSVRNTCIGPTSRGISRIRFTSDGVSAYSARSCPLNAFNSDWVGKRRFHNKNTVSSNVLLRASASISIPTYSRTPRPPSINDICVSAATVFPRPLSNVGATGVAILILGLSRLMNHRSLFACQIEALN